MKTRCARKIVIGESRVSEPSAAYPPHGGGRKGGASRCGSEAALLSRAQRGEVTRPIFMSVLAGLMTGLSLGCAAWGRPGGVIVNGVPIGLESAARGRRLTSAREDERHAPWTTHPHPADAAKSRVVENLRCTLDRKTGVATVMAAADETMTADADVTVGAAGLSRPITGADIADAASKKRDYHFDGAIRREVLENYLDRSVTMAFFLVTGVTERGRGRYPYREDDIRLIRNIGAKFIGRALYRWGGESRLNEPEFWSGAEDLIKRVHAFDPDVIFQGCLFEMISRDIDTVKIPAWVYEEFSLPVEDRTFSYDAMLNPDGKLVNHWGRSSVPDVTRRETQMWF